VTRTGDSGDISDIPKDPCFLFVYVDGHPVGKLPECDCNSVKSLSDVVLLIIDNKALPDMWQKEVWGKKG